MEFKIERKPVARGKFGRRPIYIETAKKMKVGDSVFLTERNKAKGLAQCARSFGKMVSMIKEGSGYRVGIVKD
jgi:hypothetical protein